MKTLITPRRTGYQVVCLGNIAQIDTPYLTEGSSGLTYVVDRMKGWSHSGHVTLQRASARASPTTPPKHCKIPRRPHSNPDRKDDMYRAIPGHRFGNHRRGARNGVPRIRPEAGVQALRRPAGQDVVWVPTRTRSSIACSPWRNQAGGLLIDLGAGDGKIAIAAAKKFGARSMGVEYNPDMVAFAQKNLRPPRSPARPRSSWGYLRYRFHPATVLTMYLLLRST